MQIEVINWNKFNPRTDYNCHWFRMDSAILTDPKLFDLTAEEMMVFWAVLSITCQNQGEPWKVNPRLISVAARVKITIVQSTIEKLEQLSIVRCTERIRSVDRTNPIVENDSHERTNRTNEQNERTNERTISSNSKISFEPLAVFGEVPENSVIRECGSELQETWVNTYRDPLWIKSEALKARAWLLANSHKPKKRLDRFFNAWLLKASKDLPSNKPSGSGPLNHVKNTRSFSCSTCGGTSYTNSQQGPQCVACF